MSTQTDSVCVAVPATAPVQLTAPPERMDRRAWDRIVSSAGAVLAVILCVLGGAAIYGGNFGQDNVRDRSAPEHLVPAGAMTPQELAVVGGSAGAKVDTGSEAEAFSRHIGIHLSEVNEGATYSETSGAARKRDSIPPWRRTSRSRPTRCSRGDVPLDPAERVWLVDRLDDRRVRGGRRWRSPVCF